MCVAAAARKNITPPRALHTFFNSKTIALPTTSRLEYGFSRVLNGSQHGVPCLCNHRGVVVWAGRMQSGTERDFGCVAADTELAHGVSEHSGRGPGIPYP